ncbi:unnamed protein product [Nezara viridula]|uniref:Neuropeptide n=1 Tax=Nezara viridula TaxID=85310 RepID=A0A9P0MNQ5_NEZVI|nr:unnamed protein product [Nezara viridula]
MKVFIISIFLVICYLNLISSAPDHKIEKRYNSSTTDTPNMDGWGQAIDTLEQFIFGSNPYILG